MYCTKCGTKLNDDANFCYKCGAQTVCGDTPMPNNNSNETFESSNNGWVNVESKKIVTTSENWKNSSNAIPKFATQPLYKKNYYILGGIISVFLFLGLLCILFSFILNVWDLYITDKHINTTLIYLAGIELLLVLIAMILSFNSIDKHSAKQSSTILILSIVSFFVALSFFVLLIIFYFIYYFLSSNFFYFLFTFSGIVLILTIILLINYSSNSITILKNNINCFSLSSPTKLNVLHKKELIINSFIKAIVAFLLCLLFFLIIRMIINFTYRGNHYYYYLYNGVTHYYTVSYYSEVLGFIGIGEVVLNIVLLIISILALKVFKHKAIFAYIVVTICLAWCVCDLFLDIFEGYTITLFVFDAVFILFVLLLMLIYNVLLLINKHKKSTSNDYLEVI